jgi:hypothetical protein
MQVSATAMPATLFTSTRLHRFQLTGNAGVAQSQLQGLPGFDAFLARRKDRIDKGFGGDVGGHDRLCGL